MRWTTTGRGRAWRAAGWLAALVLVAGCPLAGVPIRDTVEVPSQLSTRHGRTVVAGVDGEPTVTKLGHAIHDTIEGQR